MIQVWVEQDFVPTSAPNLRLPLPAAQGPAVASAAGCRSHSQLPPCHMTRIYFQTDGSLQSANHLDGHL